MDDKILLNAVESEFFAEVTKPEQFVTLYYERYSGDRTMLAWMKEIGTHLRRDFTNARTSV